MADSNGKAIQQIVFAYFYIVFYCKHLWCWRFIKRLSHPGLPNIEPSETLPSSGQPQGVHSIQVPVKLPEIRYQSIVGMFISNNSTIQPMDGRTFLEILLVFHGIPPLKICKEQVLPLCSPRGWSLSWRHWKRWSRRPMPPNSAESNHMVVEGNHSPDDTTHLQGQQWP